MKVFYSKKAGVANNGYSPTNFDHFLIAEISIDREVKNEEIAAPLF